MHRLTDAEHCPGCKRTFCDGCRIYGKLNTNKQNPISLPEAFAAKKQEGFGISFDLGTTTIAGMLWNLEKAVLLEVETAANPQIQFGRDIVSRIRIAMSDDTQKNKLQQVLIESLDKIAEKMLQSINGERQGFDGKIQSAVIVGNTAMCEFLMGIRPEGIAGAPFTPDYGEIIRFKGKEQGFRILKDTEIVVLPPVGGYVGSDALAGYHAIANKSRTKTILMIDIGTNAELVLQHNGSTYACSVPAGPALEGGAGSYGMRAEPGAIDKVLLNGRFPVQDIVCRVIRGGKPRGICGSGLIDALAILVQLGVVDSTGYLRTEQEARENQVPERICKRITECRQATVCRQTTEYRQAAVYSQAAECRQATEGKQISRQGELCKPYSKSKSGNTFLLTDQENPVYIEAEDIRNLQLAIAAIRAGTETLLRRSGITSAGVDEFYLAGTFGNYIDVKAGIQLGLWEKNLVQKLVQTGNLAGIGAAMVLLKPSEAEAMVKEATHMVHVELAEEETFEKLFLQYMEL